jgi:hypothetical protein
MLPLSASPHSDTPSNTSHDPHIPFITIWLQVVAFVAGSLFGSIALQAPQTMLPRPLAESNALNDNGAGLILTSARQQEHHALVLGDALVRAKVESSGAASDPATTTTVASPTQQAGGSIGSLAHRVNSEDPTPQAQLTEVPPGAAAALPSGGEEPWGPERTRRFLLPRSDDPLQYVGAARKALGSKAWEEDFMNRST